MLRLFPCCHNEQLLLLLSKETLNEGFWIPIGYRSLHSEPGAGTQLFCLIREEVSSLRYFVCWHPLQRLPYVICQYLLFKKMGG